MTEFKNTSKPLQESANKPAENAQSIEAAMQAAKVLVGKSQAKKSYTPYIILILTLLILAGSAYWAYFKVSEGRNVKVDVIEPVRTEQSTVTPTPTPLATPAPVSIVDLQNEADSIIVSTDSADLTDLNKDIQGL